MNTPRAVPELPTGPRAFRVCARCGGKLEVTATDTLPDRIERNKRCVKCGLDHLETVQA